MSPEQRAKILRELTNKDKYDCQDVDYLLGYIESLEDALIEKVEQCRRQRRELRRLNNSVRYINAVDVKNQVLVSEVLVLSELLDRENAEDADTDPSALAPTEDNFPTQQANGNNNVQIGTAVSVNQTAGVIRGLNENYNEWDMRTRYPKLNIRGVDELR